MMEFLIYDLKVAVLIAVFYMFYRLLLSKETLHRMNRVVLLGTAVTSFLLPLCVITMHETVVMKGVMGQVSFDGLAAVVEDEPQVPWWQIVLPVLYIIGMAATLAYTLISIAKVWLLIRNSEQHPGLDDITVCVTGNEDVSPFSFGSYIVMNRSDYESHDAAIMAHEGLARHSRVRGRCSGTLSRHQYASVSVSAYPKGRRHVWVLCGKRYYSQYP